MTNTKDSEIIDVAVIGSGPAALSGALYLARAGLKAVVYERGEIGGELSRIAKISNYPGFNGAGKDLAAKFRAQAEKADVSIRYGECLGLEVASPEASGSHTVFDLQIDDEKVRARAVLIATGSEPRPLPFSIAPPVSYCALCEGDLARGKNIAVVGGANSAVQESLYLAPLVKRLTLISHSPLKADQILIDRLRQCENVKIRENIEPTAALLNDFDYVFVFIGTRPATGFLQQLKEQKSVEKSTKIANFFKLEIEYSKNLKLLDQDGYILTGQGKSFSMHETLIPGVFAAGDVRSGAVKQVVAAAGDGAAAATEIIHLLRYNH